MRRKSVFRTPEEKQAILAKIQKLYDGGMPMMEATKKVDIPYTSYFKWLKDQGKGKAKKPRKPYIRKAKPYVEEIQPVLEKQDKMICVMGSPSEIACMIASLK